MQDCFGECLGTAFLDNCNVCDLDGANPDENKDCNRDCFGDAIVAIFDDTVSLIQVSVEILQSLKNRNNRNIKSRQLVLRIGLHYGDIIIQDDEIHGVGYDLASEIEPICEYGGIAISESVYSQSHENNEFIIKGINNYFFIRPIAEKTLRLARLCTNTRLF